MQRVEEGRSSSVPLKAGRLPPWQRSFEERLEKRVGEMQASQLRLGSIQADINQLAGTLPDILQRLEDKLDLRVAREHAGGRPGTRRSSSLKADGRRGALPPRRAGAGGDAWDSGSDGLAESRARRGDEQDAGDLLKLPGKRALTGTAAPDAGEAAEAMKATQGKPSSQLVKKGAPAPAGSFRDSTAGSPPPESESQCEEAGRMQELSLRLGSLETMLAQIADAVGVKSGTGGEGDDDEDRRRLKEKLKLAIEADRRSRIRPIVSRAEVWLEYIFGICQPDQRIGKRGSRWKFRGTHPILPAVVAIFMDFFLELSVECMLTACLLLLILWGCPACARLIHPRSRFTSGTGGVCTQVCLHHFDLRFSEPQSLKPLLCICGFRPLHSVCVAAFLFVSGTLLLYTAIISPAQVFLWEFKEEECNVFPTLYFDIFVDIFFMVSYAGPGLAIICGFPHDD
jgi:hypothetical protein